MALIGTMKYLTIGDKTYEIEGEQLSIASSSTLGGIKVGSGLSIDSTTGVLSTSITETDPVFSASAAAGISSSDITTWTKKSALWAVGGDYNSDHEWWNLTVDRAALHNINNAPGSNAMVYDIVLPTSQTTTLRIRNDLTNQGTSRVLTLPNTTGTLALTSDIPTVPTKVSDLTNDSGFISSYTESDPVFSASAAAGITSTDISNWNSKTSNTGTVTSVGLSNATNGGLTISGSPITNSGSITVGHTNVLTSAQTTQAVYPIKIDKNGHISAYGSAVTIPTVPTNVSSFTNDAGYLTSFTEEDPVFSASAAAGITSTDISNWNAKVSKSGDTMTGDLTFNNKGIVFKYPTDGSYTTKLTMVGYNGTSSSYTPKVSFSTDTILQNIATPSQNTDAANKKYVDDAISGVSDTDTTYALSNALSSHKFTSTLTAGGSGSGTSTATMEFVAGTGITLTDDTTNKKITIASSVVNTDEKVKSEIVTDSSLCIVGTTSSSTATGTLGKHNSFRAFMSGNTDTDGVTRLYLGNDTAAGTAGAKLGAIQIFSNSAYYVELKAGQNTRPGMTANRTVRLPDADGTIALISNIPKVYSSTNTGGYLTMATLPIYDGTVV